MESKLARSATRERLKLHRSRDEIRLAAMLDARGIKTIPQKAIGPYNCDLAAASVAVEVFGGYWHWHGKHLLGTPKRFRYLLDAGWDILVVRITGREPLTEATADYVAAFVKKASRDKSAIRQYRVVRSTGELLACGRSNDKEITIIPTLRRGQDTLSGNKNLSR